MPAANEGASQTDSRQTERLSDGQTEACTNETKSDGGIDDFWGLGGGGERDGCHGEKLVQRAETNFQNMMTRSVISCSKEAFHCAV